MKTQKFYAGIALFYEIDKHLYFQLNAVRNLDCSEREKRQKQKGYEKEKAFHFFIKDEPPTNQTEYTNQPPTTFIRNPFIIVGLHVNSRCKVTLNFLLCKHNNM